MATVTSELIWLKSLFASLDLFYEHPMQLFCSNQAALHITWNPVFHERTKHIEIDCHFENDIILVILTYATHLLRLN